MSYAINSTSTGWRAINSQSDMLPGEVFSATQPVLAVPAPTLDEIVSNFEGAVHAHLDAFAATWRYESILSAASYASSTVAQFKAESLALIAWRDQVWASCYATLAAVQNGTQAMPASPEAFVATLPAAPVRP